MPSSDVDSVQVLFNLTVSVGALHTMVHCKSTPSPVKNPPSLSLTIALMHHDVNAAFCLIFGEGLMCHSQSHRNSDPPSKINKVQHHHCDTAGLSFLFHQASILTPFHEYPAGLVISLDLAVAVFRMHATIVPP